MKYLISLHEILGAGNSRAVGILNHFGSAKEIFLSDKNTLSNCGLFTKTELRKIAGVKISDAEKIISQCHKNGIKIITINSEEYPFCLSVIENPPLVLYVKGKLPDFDNTPSICIVGPRKVSEFGKKSAFSLGYRLARSGMTVVSGGALGTDTYAHAGTLKAEGISVLVLGCGLLYKYLPENEALRKAITVKGCLISEYSPMSPPTKYTFPVRNRILSGLTSGTVVIEASQKSGALITARHANEQGRDVFVIPGSPSQKEYEGSNALLRDGAKPLLDASDIFNEYILRFPDKINVERAYEKSVLNGKKSPKEEIKEKNIKNFNETLSKEAKIVYNCLDRQKFSPEEITGTELSSSEILSALTELEMEFLIKAVPGGMYEKCVD